MIIRKIVSKCNYFGYIFGHYENNYIFIKNKWQKVLKYGTACIIFVVLNNKQKNLKKSKMITIELGNIGSKEQAEKIANKLNGKTYYNFQVEYGICAGNYPVSVSTDYEGAEENEVIEMLMFVMACEL